jgi:hypothetical protein
MGQKKGSLSAEFDHVVSSTPKAWGKNVMPVTNQGSEDLK